MTANLRQPNAYPYSMKTPMAYGIYTAGRPPIATGAATPENVPSATNLFVCEILVPVICRPDKMAFLCRGDGGNIVGSLYDAHGNLVGQTAETLLVADSIVQCDMIKPVTLVPGLYFFGFQQNDIGTLWCHNVGWHKQAAIPDQVYGTVPYKIAVPDGFTTLTGPVGGFC